VATEFALINLSMTNRNVTKQTWGNLPNITQSIWNKTSLRVTTASKHAFMARLQRAM